MAKPPDLPALPLGARVQDPFVVLDVAIRQTDDSPFTVLTLGNASGRIDSAPFWLQDQPKVAGIARGNVVQVIGEVGSYRDRRQLQVSSIRVLPNDTVDWSLLVPGVGDPEPWWDALDRWRADIAAPRLRGVVGLFYDDPEFREAFAAAPGSLFDAHARRGGLLKLTAEVVAAARPLARIGGGDLDLVVAGALLHGIGCTECYTGAWPFGLTERGALSTPAQVGAQLLEERVRTAEPPPMGERELRILQHLLACAQDTPPIPPLLLEAEALRLAVTSSRAMADLAEASRRAHPVHTTPGEAPLRRDAGRLFWGPPPDWGRG